MFTIDKFEHLSTPYHGLWMQDRIVPAAASHVLIVSPEFKIPCKKPCNPPYKPNLLKHCEESKHVGEAFVYNFA